MEDGDGSERDQGYRSLRDELHAVHRLPAAQERVHGLQRAGRKQAQALHDLQDQELR
jgi:hypothetical protein